jgi:riboflavin transporter FmnP
MFKFSVKDLAVSAICLALCMYLPFLTGQIQQFGAALAPMHIPVLLCGFICGSRYGAIVGATAPLLRFMLFGMPPLLPMGIAMCFELAVYGAAAGLLYKLFPKKALYVYVSLVLSMLIGRVVWGVAMWRVMDMALGESFTFGAFLSMAFVNALPGIVLHIVLIPPIVLVVRRITD